ncbi:hypothetical protein [Deinococcus aerius]|nr:hypothetical protein [Deinococcus aerius]
MLTVLLVFLGLGVVVALGFLLHLAWFWVSGQDYRSPEERAWEGERRRPGVPQARTHPGPSPGA